MIRYHRQSLKAAVVSCLLALWPALLVIDDISAELEPASACLDCHKRADSLLAESVHRIRVSPEGDRVTNSPFGCVDCHPGWEAHLDQPELGTIENPGKMGPFENLKLCTSCHFSPHSQESAEFNVHFRNGIGCSECHSIHQPTAEHLLVKPSNQLCLQCHQGIATVFFSVSRHPLKEGVVKCIDCHRVLREPGKAFSFASPNRECYACHSEFEGPFPFEHEAVNDYDLEKEGCIFCHEGHGSANPRLLKQPVGQLCLQCHFVPKHLTAHGGIWAKRNCLECHVDVHGSYTSRHLFADDLLGGACFGRGCHSQ